MTDLPDIPESAHVACPMCLSETTVATDEPMPSGLRNKRRCLDCGLVAGPMPAAAYCYGPNH